MKRRLIALLPLVFAVPAFGQTTYGQGTPQAQGAPPAGSGNTPGTKPQNGNPSVVDQTIKEPTPEAKKSKRGKKSSMPSSTPEATPEAVPETASPTHP